MGTLFYLLLKEIVRDSVKFLHLYLFLLKNTFHFGTSRLELKTSVPLNGLFYPSEVQLGFT